MEGGSLQLGQQGGPKCQDKTVLDIPRSSLEKIPALLIKGYPKKRDLLPGSNLHVNNNPNSGAGAGKCTTQISILNKDVIRTKLLFFAYLCLATGRLNASIG